MSSCFYNAAVVGYVSLALADNKSSALTSMQEFCRNLSVEADVFAEEVSPENESRPLWNKVLSLIEKDKVSMLVVPSLFHIAGEDKNTLSLFLDFLKAKGVKLKNLSDGVEISGGVI